MIETRTIPQDTGLRCGHCGKRLDMNPTWFIAGHGEYCSKACGEKGASELEQSLKRLGTERKGAQVSA